MTQPPPSPIRDTTTPVVLLKVKPGRCAALGVIRSLGRLGIRVHLVHSDRGEPPGRSRYLAGTSVWDLRRSGPEELVDRLLEVGRELGGRPILVPTDDVGTLFVSDRADALSSGFRFPDQPPGLARTLSNKWRLAELCREAGVPTPAAALPRSRPEVADVASDMAFPIVLKSTDPEALFNRPGGRSVVVVRSRRELLDHPDLLDGGASPDVMIQEYVPGGPSSVWMFNGYFDDRSECLFGATGRKLHQQPPYTGMTALGVCRRNPDVEAMTTTLMRRLGYRGIVDLGFRYDRRDGRYKLLDVNPRIGATFRLFVAPDGMDVARALYLDLTGQAVPRAEVREGRKWIVETHDVSSGLRYWRDGILTLGEWAGSLRGVEEFAYWALDDVEPAVEAYRRVAGRLVGGLGRRVRLPADPRPGPAVPPTRRARIARRGGRRRFGAGAPWGTEDSVGGGRNGAAS